jgi:hypothetical protein
LQEFAAFHDAVCSCNDTLSRVKRLDRQKRQSFSQINVTIVMLVSMLPYVSVMAIFGVS